MASAELLCTNKVPESLFPIIGMTEPAKQVYLAKLSSMIRESDVIDVGLKNGNASA